MERRRYTNIRAASLKRGDTYRSKMYVSEETCWVLWLRETEAETPVVEVVISVDALVSEVQA